MNTFTSSVNNKHSEVQKHDIISLWYIVYIPSKDGPEINPWGIPAANGADSDAASPTTTLDSFLGNFESFIILLGASDVTIIDKAAANILAFIHFSMIQGIAKNDHL